MCTPEGICASPQLWMVREKVDIKWGTDSDESCKHMWIRDEDRNVATLIDLGQNRIWLRCSSMKCDQWVYFHSDQLKPALASDKRLQMINSAIEMEHKKFNLTELEYNSGGCNTSSYSISNVSIFSNNVRNLRVWKKRDDDGYLIAQ